MPYAMDEPTRSHACTLRLPNGQKCDRVMGPYYDVRALAAAIARHRAAQHVNTQEKMVDREPGDARIKSALSRNPTYEPPSSYHGQR